MKIIETEIYNTTKNLNINNLEEKNYTSLDSFTINQDNNSITSLIVLNRNEKIPTQDDVIQYLNINENYIHMFNRVILSKILKVPLFLFSVEDNFKKCQILEIKLNKNNKSFDIDYFHDTNYISFEEMSYFYQDLRREQRKKVKPLEHIPSSNLISKFKDVGMNLGGNLDGFKIDKDNNKIQLVEFSKIGATPDKYDHNGEKTMDYNFDKFMYLDFGRWHSLETLRKEINKKYDVNFNVIVWSFINSYMKVFEDVKFVGERNKYLKCTYQNIIRYSNIKNKLKV